MSASINQSAESKAKKGKLSNGKVSKEEKRTPRRGQWQKIPKRQKPSYRFTLRGVDADEILRYENAVHNVDQVRGPVEDLLGFMDPHRRCRHYRIGNAAQEWIESTAGEIIEYIQTESILAKSDGVEEVTVKVHKREEDVEKDGDEQHRLADEGRVKQKQDDEEDDEDANLEWEDVM